MRPWYKYGVDFERSGRTRLGMDETFADHEKSMAGYGDDDAYESKEAFFNRFLHGFQFGRLENYCDFLKNRISPERSVYSIGSGRAAVEMFLSDQGFDVTCSELERPACHAMTEKLFPGFRFAKHDILTGPAAERYDVLLCFSLIYLFDSSQLTRLCQNVAASLNPGGVFILDSAGAPDNRLAAFLHEGLLRWETIGKCWLHRLSGNPAELVEKHFGFRHSDTEIVESARRSGFALRARKDYAFLSDFRRSAILYRIINPDPLSPTGRFFSKLGRRVPYTRMFEFQLEPVSG